MSEASENSYPLRVSKHVITWVQLEDPQVTWFCFPLKLQEISNLGNQGEEASSLLRNFHDKPDFGKEKSIGNSEYRESPMLGRLQEEFDDGGFLLRSILDSVVKFGEETVDNLIAVVLSNNFPGQSDDVPKGKNKRTIKVKALIKIYEGNYSSDGIYRLMMDISKYYPMVADKISSMYKMLNSQHIGLEAERDKYQDHRKISDR